MTEEAATEKPGDESAGKDNQDKGQPSLDSLLADYGKGDDKKSEANESLLGEVKQLREDLATRDYRDVMDREVIPTVKGDFALPDDYVEHWVNKQADADPRLLELWDNRSKNPAAFRDAMSALKPEFEKHVSKEFGQKPGGDDASASRLASVVKGSRENDASASAGFDNVNWAGLSDHELTLKKREVFNAAERGELR